MVETNDIFFKQLMDIPFVYHYTSVEALFSILEGYRINGHSALPFWASCVYNSNDPKEMVLGYETVKEILPQYEKSCVRNMNLSEVYTKIEYEEQYKERFYTKRPKDGFVEKSTVPYTISFSCKKDFLPMWSMYGENKKGVCLRFNLGILIDNLKDNMDSSFVHYEGDKDNIIRDHLLPTLYDWDALFVEKDKKELSIEDKIKELCLLCDCVSPFVKDKDWVYESEFRIVYCKHYGPWYNDLSFKGLHLMLNKIKVDNHVTLPIEANSLEEIIIGPMANYNVLEHVLRNELKECLLNSVEITPSSIQITK